MIKIGKDKFIFDEQSAQSYRRLSVRECARIQTFPNNFIFDYQNINAAYKMIGNAVPVNLSFAIAQAISYDLFNKGKTALHKHKQNNLNSKISTLLNKQLELDLPRTRFTK